MINFSSLEDQHHMLHTLQQRYSHWPDGRPLEQLFRKTWLTYYYELTSENSKVDKNIKTLIKLCGEEVIQLLFEQNPQLLEGKLDSLDGMKLEGSSYDISGFDLSGCSMNSTVLKSVRFIACKLNTERLNSATIKNVYFRECSFEGESFSLSVLDNVHFMPEIDFKDKRVFDRTQKLSQIIYQSCVDQQNELNLNQWLEVMLKNYFLRCFSTPLDDSSLSTFSQYSERIIRDNPHQLCEIIHKAIDIQFTSIDCAINFVRNNPEFYDRKVIDFRDLYFDFRTLFLRADSPAKWRGILAYNISHLSSNAYNGFSREAVLELIFNTVNLAMFPQLGNEYIEFKDNINSADNHNDWLKKISEEDNESTKNNTIPCPESDNIISRKAVLFLELEDFQNYFHELWEACSDESKLTIAKYCLSHHVVAVSHFTKVEFMKFLTKKQQQN